jgi:uncharacterized membrane protein YccC
MAFMLSPLLKRYTWNSTWLYYVRIFIALCGTTALPWWLGDVKLTIPLTLGMVAAALTDLDDRLAGRLRNLIITLVCFLLPQPPLNCSSHGPGCLLLG